MKRHLIKKNVTAIIFMVLLFSFAIINMIHTWPHLRDIDQSKIDSLDGIQQYVSTTENVINENVLGKYTFVETYGLWNLLLNKNEVDGFTHIKDKNGYLHYSNFWNKHNDDVSGLVQKVLDLRDQVKEYGTEVIVVLPPVKDSIENVTYETGMPYSDKNWVADEYIEILKVNNINVIDFRETLKNSGLTYEETFYITDHHWTTPAVFECYKEFILKMENWYDLELDAEGLYTDKDNYNVLVYKDSNLGSQGRETGIVYSGGLDDFTLIYPKYYTNFSYKWYNQNTESVLYGRFEETLVSTYNIVNSSIYTQDKYAGYMNGINAYDTIVNLDNPDGKNILFLRDSCTSPFAAFVAQSFSRTDLLWTLKLDNNLDDYVNVKDYDYIVISLYPDSLKNDMFKIGLGQK